MDNPISVNTYSSPGEIRASLQGQGQHMGRKTAPAYSVQMPGKPQHCWQAWREKCGGSQEQTALSMAEEWHEVKLHKTWEGEQVSPPGLILSPMWMVNSHRVFLIGFSQ